MSVLSNYSNKFSNKIGIIQNDIIDSNEIDYIVGDKVYIASNPEKTGIVAYNGITKFSDGIWIGVALYKPLGKHNGIVQGVTYFQCDEKHGIFVRKNNLRHVNQQTKNNFKLDISEDQIEIENQLNNSNLPKLPDDDSLFVQSIDFSSKSNLVLGETVCVTGKSSSSTQKIGILRFIGCTKFAEGIWAGIELDNPVGRNDGSVEGVRYFSCKPQYGLFALESKVQKYSSSISKNIKNNNKIDNQSKFGSNESVSSVASNFSSASRTRVRLGMNAVGSNGKPRAYDGSGNKFKNPNSIFPVKDIKEIGQGSTAFQKVLKEKEQHVEQLIRERESERIDLAIATSKIEELERQISRQMNAFNEQNILFENKLLEIQNNYNLIQQEKNKLIEKLDEEKKKTEDLLFQIEEKNIDESDLENKTEESEHQIFELNEKLSHEKDLREALEKKIVEISENHSMINGENIITSLEIEKLKIQILSLQKDLYEERSNSKTSVLLKALEEKEAVINDISDRFENAKSKLEQSLSQIKYMTLEFNQIKINLNEELQKNIHLQNEKDSLNNDISNLKKLIGVQMEKINEFEIKAKQNEINYHNNIDCNSRRIKHNQTSELIINNISKIYKTSGIQTDEGNFNKINYQISNLESNENEIIIHLKKEIEKIKKNNDFDKKSIIDMESRIKSYSEELIEKDSEIMDLKQNLMSIKCDNINNIKSKEVAIEEKDKLCTELSVNHIQLEKLRKQISDMLYENKNITDTISEAKQKEINLNLEMDELKEKIEFLEKENQVLNEYKHIEDSNSTLNMSKKITDLESMVHKLNGALKNEKDTQVILITENATLYSKLENMRQSQDDFKNLTMELENIKAMNADIESERNSLLENFDVKNNELMIVRERLLKISQEFEDLQESHKNLSQKFDREKRISSDKIRKLEKQLDEPDRKSQFSHSDSCSDKRKPDGKDQLSMLKTAKYNAEEQISFLNLVIVEREKKLKSLELENEGLLDKIKDLENGNTSFAIKQKKIVPPRLYCDICEVFDRHDTEQCSIVSNSSPQSSPLLKIRQRKESVKAPRLYCDICEIFDLHNTSDCQDEQTF